MHFLRRSLTGLILLSLTLGLLAYAGYVVSASVQARMERTPGGGARDEREFAVKVILATPQTIAPTLTAYGEVQSRRTLELRAKAAGTVTLLAEDFEEGGQVEAGQLLVRIDPADARSARDRAQSDLMDARAEAREAARALELAEDELSAARDQAALQERALQRQRDLEERGVGTAAAVETAELAAAAARGTVLTRRQAALGAEARVDQAATATSRAEIALAEAERRLAETEIRAEFAGALSEVAVDEGALVSNGEQLGTLIDRNALEVAFRVSTAQFARLLDEGGQLRRAPVTAVLEASGARLTAPGTITRASAAVGEGQTGRQVFARLDAARGLKPGDFVTVEVAEPPLTQVVRLPASALGSDGAVLALGEDGRLEPLAVTLIRRQGDDVLVRAGDASPELAGRRVVMQRTPLLGAGVKVRALGDAAAASGEATDETSEMMDLSEERRARLIAYVEGSRDMPDAVRTRLLDQLAQSRVPASVVARLETRMGG
ncbi:RND family efflux transporter, MFP subunit [Roseovarius nanhaiticus]|uniref:RND family efflux transporter, MFP subunit n=1 Tax=Roseovarius nanhaiticus TaxID=573024 RepID=A0A1N7F727_9RHOB|nr:HlyD family efflux transporter periplasmic adaptor subunit [Roseovarius nanhaiticus]SEK60347.1 RND family efflux transporter, MFP subunit [Roseovarius nanhaiticus]SIR96129.1 RND family efflux transporter, MFP subunit [Roseovarius nanhaiticus]